MNFQGYGVEVGIKNPSKIEAQDGLPLSIDFWWILVGFGRQLGLENPSKSEEKSIGKRIEKIMKKRCPLAAPGGGGAIGALMFRRVPGTPLITNYQLPITNTNTTDHRPQASKTISHALRAPARWRIF